MPDIVYNENFMITSIGGFAIRLLNKSGAASAKGDLVEPSGTTDSAFTVITADDLDPFGVVYETGVADGALCWVVISGVAEVCLEDQVASTRGYWARVSITENGRADITNAAPGGGTIAALEAHLHEIGHCLESKVAGAALERVLAKCVIHFL